MSTASWIDMQLVERVVAVLHRRVDKTRYGPVSAPGGLRNFSEAERVVLLAYWAVPIIENGGWQYFYEGATNAAEVAAALERLGLTKAADAARRSLAIFSNGVPPEDQNTRWAILEADRDAFFGPLDEAVWETGEILAEALAAFIRAHKEQFGDLFTDENIDV